MKQIKRLKLNQIDKDELKKKEQLEILGGDNCCGFCIPSDPAYPESDWENTYRYK